MYFYKMEKGETLPEPAVPRPHSAPATAPSVFSYRESRENVANNSDFGSSDSDSDSDNDRYGTYTYTYSHN